jgi:hypothetical protein
MLDGDFARADRLAAESLAFADEGDLFDAHLAWVMQRLSQALLLEDLQLLAPHADRILNVVDRLETVATWGSSFRVLMLAALGRQAEARRRMSAQARVMPDFPGAVLRGNVSLLLRDRQLAEEILPAFVEARKMIPFFWLHGLVVFGPTARMAAELAALAGRVDEARTFLDEAFEEAERLGSPSMVRLVRARREALV